jgi:VIT1/CCC1 family predicted Fe2+/Mn2+ transporter
MSKVPHRRPRHEEAHFQSSDLVRDIVFGMADGLTVPFALAAGLSGAVASSHIIVLAGFAEIVAGSISMGLGGFLAARGDAEHYFSERAREADEIVHRTHDEEEEIYVIFEKYGVSRQASLPVLDELKKNPENWVDFLMQFELSLEEPNPRRAVQSAATIASAYVVGGTVPLLPYIFSGSDLHIALRNSVILTLLALIVFGAIKGKALGSHWLKSALQTVLIGGAAAAAAYYLARLLNTYG